LGHLRHPPIQANAQQQLLQCPLNYLASSGAAIHE
jgi:hypothetical protein